MSTLFVANWHAHVAYVIARAHAQHSCGGLKWQLRLAIKLIVMDVRAVPVGNPLTIVEVSPSMHYPEFGLPPGLHG